MDVGQFDDYEGSIELLWTCGVWRCRWSVVERWRSM